MLWVACLIFQVSFPILLVVNGITNIQLSRNDFCPKTSQRALSNETRLMQ